MKSQSMPRFASLLSTGMQKLGHDVELWYPKPFFYRIPAPGFIKKWLGYIDQYVVFPLNVKQKIRKEPVDSLFVFTDQALGPWVPLVKHRPHAIHCHDFLAQRSALGEIPENPTSWTGKLYQKFIYKGYIQGENFISVSQKTQEDLHRFLNGKKIRSSVVVYNGLNQDFKIHEVIESRNTLSTHAKRDLHAGYILHVGGNQWYKNRIGVIKIYEAWRKAYPANALPLVLVGANPSASIQEVFAASPFKKDILFLTGLSDHEVQLAYSGAQVFLFPSLAEGFGWPIAEAMACGCPVITTDAAPMSEVSGDAGGLIPLYTTQTTASCASILEQLVHLPKEKRTALIEKGFAQIKKFDTNSMLRDLEHIYKQQIANDASKK
ncbi:glycosyltransferase [uncultured Cytophaga sp.]|uniref:glycosyltransferase n=1 Tax=uncultured Cytophaga sp. TaxID=160238 RepID=UPI00261B438A|nr:glycosyltransferase [uncultured Cytophaga sp.]